MAPRPRRARRVHEPRPRAVDRRAAREAALVEEAWLAKQAEHGFLVHAASTDADTGAGTDAGTDAHAGGDILPSAIRVDLTTLNAAIAACAACAEAGPALRLLHETIPAAGYTTTRRDDALHSISARST